MKAKVSIYGKMSDYLPELDSTNKSDIVVLDVMAHRAQLFPWIPFYQQTVTKSRRNPRPLSKYYTKKVTSQNTIPVTEKLYMRDDYLDKIKTRYTNQICFLQENISTAI